MIFVGDEVEVNATVAVVVLLASIVEENAKFQLEVSEKM